MKGLLSFTERLIILFIIMIPFSCPLYGQESVFIDNPENELFSFNTSGLDRVLQPSNNTAFFYGETHTRFFEPLFKLHYIKYLNSHCNVNEIFMEFGYSAAVLFNQFLESGDTSLLNLRILYTSPNYMKMWDGLYQYNQKLGNDKKIRIHGVDYESHKTFFKALEMLKLSGIAIPESLKNIDKLIVSSATDTTLSYDKTFFNSQKIIKKVFDRNSDDVRKLYGINAPIVYKIVNNDFTMTDKRREEKMAENMQRVVEQYHVKKLVGFFGGDHVNYSNPTALPIVLRQNKDFENKVVSMRMFCFNAFDNWSKEILKCIGTYEERECSELYEKYMSGSSRAVLLPDRNVTEHFLKGTADCYLLANDRNDYK